MFCGKLRKELKAAKAQIDRLQRQEPITERELDLHTKLSEAKVLLSSLVKGIDDWNAAVEKIMGSFPNYNWGALEKARKFLNDDFR